MNICIEHIAAHTYCDVVDLNRGRDKLLRMDFTREQDWKENVVQDTECFCKMVEARLTNAGARYGIGGYLENRSIYRRSKVFDAKDTGEQRTVHLGMDIWGPTGTEIYAPLNGKVHSYAFNNAFGDYGATLVLEHLINGCGFYTLYGHLSLSSLEDKYRDQIIEAGKLIAYFGKPEENGNWPPHLHFQVILDMEGMEGDYPGVCARSELRKYSDNCPDPDLILKMMDQALEMR